MSFTVCFGIILIISLLMFTLAGKQRELPKPPVVDRDTPLSTRETIARNHLQALDRAKFANQFRLSLKLAGILGIVISVTAFGVKSFTLVKATEVGVPVTLGKVGEHLPSGINWVAPWTSVETYPTRPVTVDRCLDANTAQSGKVHVCVSARWAVVPARASDLYFQVRTGNDKKISNDIVLKALGEAIGLSYNGMDNITAANDWAGARGKVQAEYSRILATYGIAGTDVRILGVDPDPKTKDSIARFAAQQRETEIAKEAKNTAIQEAARRLTEAKGLRDAANTLPDFSPEQVTALCAQAWERMAARAIAAGQPLYSGPCGNGIGAVASK